MSSMETRNEAAGFLILRAFFAQFWLLQFFGKLYDQDSHIIAWRNLDIWSTHLTAWFVKQTALPGWLVRPYSLALPYAELALALLWLTGFQTRRTVLASAILIVSLEAGLLIQLKHDTVALNMIHLLALILALRWAHQNRWSLDEFLGVNA
jgi:thiosulfate dehydrogenase [quinone] large subunit